MTTHLEYVTGTIGERIALPCVCGRAADHERLGSVALAAASAPQLGAGHAAGHRGRAAALRTLTVRAVRGRHAA